MHRALSLVILFASSCGGRPRTVPTATATPASAAAKRLDHVHLADRVQTLKTVGQILANEKWSFTELQGDDNQVSSLLLWFTYNDSDLPDARIIVSAFESSNTSTVVYITCWSQMRPATNGVAPAIEEVNKHNAQLGAAWAFLDTDLEIGVRMGFVIAKDLPLPSAMIVDAIDRTQDIWRVDIFPALTACTACGIERTPAAE